MGTAPPGMLTVRKSAAIAGPAGTCCTQGSSSPRMMTAPQISRPAGTLTFITSSRVTLRRSMTFLRTLGMMTTLIRPVSPAAM